MAAGWTRHLGGEHVGVFSGGSEPADQVNPMAVAVMAEVGIDISRFVPEKWSDEGIESADVVVTMGCGDTCPIFPGKTYLDWDLDDPSTLDIDGVRSVRDEIEDRVRQLLEGLDLSVN